MAENNSIRTKYQVQTDACDWPLGLSREEQEQLCNAAKTLLVSHGEMTIYDVHNCLRGGGVYATMAPEKWRKGIVLDWTYGCLERALRAIDATEKWHIRKASGSTQQAYEDKCAELTDVYRQLDEAIKKAEKLEHQLVAYQRWETAVRGARWVSQTDFTRIEDAMAELDIVKEST